MRIFWHDDRMEMAPKPPRSWRRLILRIILVVPVLLLLGETFRVIVWSNRHTVIAGRVYRTAQPYRDDLVELTKKHGIRTVINLRGLSPDGDWYQEESKACHDLNISQEDITLSANRLPPPAELRRLVEVLDRTEYPVLIHCKRGADRTGLVSTLVLLLQSDLTLDQAMLQLVPRYGHFRFGRTAAIDEFFEFYIDWLTKQNLSHSRAVFRDWVMNHYQPGVASSELSWVEPPPSFLKADLPIRVKVRAKNTSNTPWELKPGNYSGVHLAFVVFTEDGQNVWSDRAGLRHEVVPPGGVTEIEFPVMGLQPGKYKLIAEMHDATGAGIPFRTNSFVQYGDDSLAADLWVK